MGDISSVDFFVRTFYGKSMRGVLKISFLIVIGIFIGIFTAGIIFLTFFNRFGTQGVYGTFDINGVVLQGATITLLQKERGSNNPFVAFEQGVTPEDEGVWHFDEAKTGKSYEIKGLLLQNGQVIYQTSPIFVTAPMINQILVFDIPAKVSPGAATISGNVGINGYIPPGATIGLQARIVGTKQFTMVTKGIPALDNQTITYPNAVAGKLYEIQGILFDSNGNIIGSSSLLQVAAPAYNEELSINSTMQPPATPTPTVTPTPQPVVPVGTATPTMTATPTPSPTPTPQPTVISGIIRFGGQAPSNSRIVIFQRPVNSSQYLVAVNNVAPEDGTTWQWTGGQVGVQYDLIAILKQKQSDGTDKDISNSNVLTVSAPAANEVFTINSGYILPAPSGSITVNCDTYDSGSNTWNIGISYQSVENAQSYWYQIGTTNGGYDLTNFTQNATSNSYQSFTQQIKNGVTYYARYAYANVQNLRADSSQFSPFSSTKQFSCSK